MLPEYFAVIGAIIASLGGIYYLYETITGKAKPNRVTWVLWGVFPMITFAAQRSQGVSSISWASFVAGLTPILVVAASFYAKDAYWKTKPIDFACMTLGIIGMLLWAITNSPNIAILFSIFADAAAAFPTILKSYKNPETESWIAYSLSALGFGVGLFSIHSWNFQNYAFLSYLFAINGLLSILSSQHKVLNQTE